MNRIALVLASLTLALVLGAAGCGNGSSTADAGGTGGGDMVGNPNAYPSGPYGTQVGSTIKDLSLRVQTGAGGTFADKKLSDYRADYLAGKLKVLVIVGAAYWCEPCKAEQPDLVTLSNDYKAKNAGVAFLDVVVEDLAKNAATEMQVNDWAVRYSIPFDLAADPNRVLTPYFDTNTFPNALVIKLSDMTIQFFHSGKDTAALKAAIDEALK